MPAITSSQASVEARKAADAPVDSSRREGSRPQDEIKIDKSFVMGLAQSGNRAIVRSIIELGRVFDLRVVAEGVNDQAAWDEVRAQRCHVAQGVLSQPADPSRHVPGVGSRADVAEEPQRGPLNPRPA